MSARNVAFFPHAFVNTSLVCAVGVIARACVTSFGWPSRGSEPASNAAAVVDRVSEKAECALRRYRFVFLYISLFLHFCFVQPRLCGFGEASSSNFHFTSNVACFQPPTHTELNERERTFVQYRKLLAVFVASNLYLL